MFRKTSDSRKQPKTSVEQPRSHVMPTYVRYSTNGVESGPMDIPPVWQYSKTLELRGANNQQYGIVQPPTSSPATRSNNKSHHLSTLDLSQVEEAKGKGFRFFRSKPKSEDKHQQRPPVPAVIPVAVSPHSHHFTALEIQKYPPGSSSQQQHVFFSSTSPSSGPAASPRSPPVQPRGSSNIFLYQEKNLPHQPRLMEVDRRQKSVSMQQLNSTKIASDFPAAYSPPPSSAVSRPTGNYLTTGNSGSPPTQPIPALSSTMTQTHVVPVMELESTSSTTDPIPPLHFPPVHPGGPPTLSLPIECLVAARRLEAASRILLLNSAQEMWRMDLHHLVPLARGRTLTRLVPDCRDEMVDRAQRVGLLLHKIEALLCHGGQTTSTAAGEDEQEVAHGEEERLPGGLGVWYPLATLSEGATAQLIHLLDDLVTMLLSLMELSYHIVYSLALRDSSWRPATRGVIDRKTLLFAADDIDMCCLRLRLAVQLYRPSSSSLSSSSGPQDPSPQHVCVPWSNDAVLTSSCGLLNSALAYLAFCCRTVKRQIQSQNLTLNNNNNHISVESEMMMMHKPSSGDHIPPPSQHQTEVDLQPLSLSVHAMSSTAKCVLASVQGFHRAALLDSGDSGGHALQPMLKQRIFSQVTALQSVVAALLDMLAGEWQFVGSPANALLPLACKSARDSLSGACLVVVSSCIRWLEALVEVGSTFSPTSFTPALRDFHFGVLPWLGTTLNPHLPGVASLRSSSPPVDPKVVLEELRIGLVNLQHCTHAHLSTINHHNSASS